MNSLLQRLISKKFITDNEMEIIERMEENEEIIDFRTCGQSRKYTGYNMYEIKTEDGEYNVYAKTVSKHYID